MLQAPRDRPGARDDEDGARCVVRHVAGDENAGRQRRSAQSCDERTAKIVRLECMRLCHRARRRRHHLLDVEAPKPSDGRDD